MQTLDQSGPDDDPGSTATPSSQPRIAPFWANGFEATTLSDLEEATGADRSTIYNSFGGKIGLYRSAAAAYVDLSHDALFQPLHKGTAGISDIVDFLDGFSDMLNLDTNPPGCLIVNDMAADTDIEATNRYLETLEGGFGSALERAAALGEIAPDTSAPRRQTLTAAILGINLVHRSSAAATPAQTLINGLRAEVGSWLGQDVKR